MTDADSPCPPNRAPRGSAGAPFPSSATRRAPAPASPAAVADALAAARETRALETGSGALDRTMAVFRREFPERTALVVADPTTWAVAGERVFSQLRAAQLAPAEPHLLSAPGLHAESRFVDELEAVFRRSDAIPVAVGSGTINDLVKLAAHRVGRPYLCVATAASMDGYTAFGASITHHGSKQTFDCPAPRGVIADLDVIRRAPAAMTASGYADLLAKVTAGADWILADALGVEPIDARAWSIVQGGLRGALADPAGARAGAPAAIGRLIEGLLLGGFAMQWSKSSRPASGAEHQFSHLWDMEHHVHHGAAPSHGFKVGIATLAVTALYEEILRQPLERLDVARCCERWPTLAGQETAVARLFAGTEFTDRALEETRVKYIDAPALARQLERLKQVWPELRERLEAQLLPAAELRDRLARVGAPVAPEDIGLTPARVRASFVRAYHIRRRFTVLDLAVRTGLLEPALDAMTAPAAPAAAP
ncbi:MAG TPA: sn-glycerol-1-phosphate dehydrogenase [Opitutaceae bacterium]|nr:sn-glycerol-1-phosphate dehydrogenase [Opitutaceae bacterium]